jgi:triosephosphate isomerase
MVSLPDTQRALHGSPILVGSQNVHWATSGAFTGETSPSFLREMGIPFSIVGHSERRTYFGETSETVAQRTKAALSEGLTAIVCIGETERERTSGITEKVLEEQLTPVFEQISPDTSSRVVLAYEPVWAIGTGRVASLAEISETHRFILSLWKGRGFGSDAVVLYGGSVNPQNFAEILALPEVDGALVGGASIKLDQWLTLARIAEETPIAA